MHKKGQGMSFSMIVKIILAILVLSTVIVLFTGGIRRLSGSLAESSAGATSATKITSVRTQCTQYCLSMDNILAGVDHASEMPYCTTVFSITEDADPDDEDRCYDTVITGGSDCEVTLSTGQRVKIGREQCLGGSFGQIGGGRISG